MSEESISEPVSAEIPEAQAETYAERAGFPVELGNGETVTVPPQIEWRKSAVDYMRLGDFDAWAESVLAPEDLDRWDEWMDTDPKMGELSGFFERLGKVTGQSVSPNRASRRSSARTARR